MEASWGEMAKWVVGNWVAVDKWAEGNWVADSWANPVLVVNLVKAGLDKWVQVNLGVANLAKAVLGMKLVE